MPSLPRNVWILTASLSLFMSLSIFVIFLGGIIGQSLSPIKTLSTLPVALLVVGTASSIIPIGKLMIQFGRRHVFLGVCAYTLMIISLAVIALQIESFALFCLATFLFGITTATMNQFRFAALECVDQALSATAVLAGGLVSAFLGPELATIGQHLFATKFVGSFALLSVCFILAFILLWHYQAPTIMQHEHQASHRSLIVIIKQKVFIIAMSSAAVGYIIMSYIMTATPISMHVIDGFSLQQTKFVIQTLNDFLIFSLQAIASLSAGWFVFNFGWESVLLSVAPLLIVQLMLLLWWLNNKVV